MKTLVILTCGHEKDYTGRAEQVPAVGEYHPCFSSCDQVPTRNPHLRYVKKVVEVDDDAMEP